METNEQTSALLKDSFNNKTNALLALAFTLTASIILFYNLEDFRTLGPHEAYAAVPARGMLESDNWVVPQFGGVPRLKKPPLAYWSIASSAKIWGTLDEWSARFPAAVSALLLSVLMGVWAKRWYGNIAGWGAAFFQLTSAYIIIYSRKAEVDMLLWLLMTASLFLIAHQPVNESRSRSFVRWVGIYALLGLTWLAKFHYGPAIVLGIAVSYYAIQGRYRAYWNLLNPVGLALFAAAVLVWPYMLFQRVPAEQVWAVWQKETVGRAVGSKGLLPYWFYIPHILWLTLPWTHLAFMGVKKSWSNAWLKSDKTRPFFRQLFWKNGDSREQFLWVWFLVVFGIVTISAAKHKHYVASGLPVFTLLACQTFSKHWQQLRNGDSIFSRRSATAIGVASFFGAFACWFVITGRWPHLSSVTMVLSCCIAVGGVAAALLTATRYRQTAIATSIFTCLACYIIVNGSIVPHRDDRLPTALFAQEIRQEVPPAEQLKVYRLGMHPIFYYLDDNAVRLDTVDDVKQALADQSTLTVVADADDIKDLEQLGTVQIIDHASNHAPANAPQRDDHVVALLRAHPNTAQTQNARMETAQHTLRR